MYARAASVLLILASCQSHPTPLADATLIDLSYAYNESTIYWPTAGGFELVVDAKGYQDGGYYYEANTFRSAEHGGTHLDAPVHFAEGRWANHEIPLDRLVGPGVVVDVSDQALADRDYRITVDDLTAWESIHGPLPDGAIVLFRTGYGQFWPDRTRYLGTSLLGLDGVAALHFPGLSAEAALWLRQERTIYAVGIDTPSIDYGQSTDYAAHVTLFSGNIVAFENVANLHALPATGFDIIALPMKITGGSGGPLRIIAILP